MVTGKLPYGIEFNGQRQRDIEMRLPTMGDNIDALNAHPDANIVEIEMAMFAAATTRLGDIPLEEITYDLFRALLPNDYDYLTDLLAEAKKKLREDMPS